MLAKKVLSCLGLPSTEVDSSLTEDVTVLKAIVSSSSRSELLGRHPVDQIEINQWITYSQLLLNLDTVTVLNTILLSKSYLVGNSQTLADFCVYVALSEIDNLNFEAFPEVKRWFDHIQNLSVNSNLVPFRHFTKASSIFHVSAFTDTIQSEVSNQVGAAAVKDACVDKIKCSKPIAPTDAAPVSAISADSLDPTKLDIRCGLIVKCWNHPDSDKLLCEEIDLGGDLRSIASGLRAYYTAEQLQGRKVLVLANLKERPMAGFKSQGMVLCAVSKDHSQVQLLEVPEGAKVGDRVTFPGFPADSVAATPAQMAKKKILEGLGPQLRTDDNGNAHWFNSPFILGALGGMCSSTLSNAIVS